MRFITCRLPDGVEDPAILSADGRQVWPLSWLGLSYEPLSDAIPFLTPQVQKGPEIFGVHTVHILWKSCNKKCGSSAKNSRSTFSFNSRMLPQSRCGICETPCEKLHAVTS